MELGKWLKHVYAISIVVLLHINASLSHGHHSANVTRCVERERNALLAVKRDLVDNYNLLSSWREAQKEDCCRWEGVYCDDQTGHVLRLDLGANLWHDGEFALPALQGKISPQLIQLHDLTYLNLSFNEFNGGEIPAFIGSLTRLRYLDLSRAGFGGQIPSHALGNLTHLQYLNLGENYFTDSVENLNWLPHLPSLKYLDLRGTNLSNVFDWPETVRKLPNLRSLSLSNCGLSRSPNFPSLYGTNSSTSLARVDLSDFSSSIAITSSIFKWLCNNNTILVHLDLSLNELSGLIPDVFTNMSSLTHLDLSLNRLTGLIPDSFRNMNSLEHLDLSLNQLSGSIPDVFRNMSSLAHLDLSMNQLTGLIPDGFRNLRSLELLDLSSNKLSGSIPDVFSNMSSLAHLHLSDNLLEGRIPKSISQLCSLHGQVFEFVQRRSTCPQNSLQNLDLSCNDLTGSFPNFTNFSSLMVLSLYKNQLSGIVPESIGELSSLEELDLSENHLSGRIPESIGQMSSLQNLDLSNNRLSGMIPESIGQLSLLGELDFSRNRLSGRIPQSIGQLSNLYTMNLSMNSLKGVITETHFSNLSNLHKLDLSFNSLVFNVTSDWVPSFQLNSLNLRSCNVGPDFPQWLRTQKSFYEVDISYAGISEVLPSWFWDIFGGIQSIDFSHNQIRGTLFENSTLDVALNSGLQAHFGSNQFEGPIPSILSDVLYLDLSNNRFSEITSFLCSPKVKGLKFLNLNSNHVSEELPDCWRSLVNLVLLDLSNNAFFGKIPTTIGSLFRIETLKLRSNRLVGELPSSLKNCTSLKVLDLANNKLSRSVPEWLGLRFPNLVVLMLQFNQFNGSLPSQLCHLTSIQILDFSMNEISGTIPNCLKNLTSLSQEGNSSSPTIRHSYDKFDQSSAGEEMSYFMSHQISTTYYEDDATFMWKGKMYSYKSTLGLVKRIDLSSNRLTGEIPSEITYLVGLVSLNLSRNHLTGQITPNIGNLKSLDSLDLSRNQIDGGIPTSLAQIDRLSFLDLSYNDLSGEIPTGTQLQGFDPTVYAGNPRLCGRPLEKICEGIGRPNFLSDPDELITKGFYISLGLGFAVGFWGVCGSLIFKRSWRYAYYKFLNSSNDWLYVKVALIRRQLMDKFHRQS